MSTQARILPRSFLLSRLHSLTGLWIVIFLFEHLITNSQAALFFGEDGVGFIRMVNFLKSLPYLHVVEIGLIGIPIAYHAVLGIRYALTGKFNSYPSDGKKPYLSYGRNIAYTFQRISAWILLIGIILHVSFMRFSIYPYEAKDGINTSYFVRLHMDTGLYTVSDRLNIKLYDQSKINEQKSQLPNLEVKIEMIKQRILELDNSSKNVSFVQDKMNAYETLQRLEQKKEWIKTLLKRPIDATQVIAVSKEFGSATLLNVRDAFKSPLKIALYTLFVLAACFHGFNGLWTFCMSWGVMIKVASQKKVLRFCIAMMILLAFLGLSSVWGTYFFNLKN